MNCFEAAFLPVLPLVRYMSVQRGRSLTISYPHTTTRRRLRCATQQPQPPPKPRQTDPRGFLLPEQGDVVLYQGRWAEEDAAGLVESIQFVPERSAHIVDVLTMRRVASDLFAVTRGKNRVNTWFDVADVRLVPDAQYVPEQDAYRVAGARDGYAVVKPLDDAARARAQEEYRALKQMLLAITGTAGFVGTLGSGAIFGLETARAYGYGALGSIVYLAMLQGGVDTVGEPSLSARLFGLRFIVPVLPFLILAFQKVGAVEVSQLLGSVNRAEALALVLGLLTYKVPLIGKTAGEFVDGLAEIEMGKTGMVGTVASMTARQIKKQRDKGKDAVIEDQGENSQKPVFVFAGPSGVGKSTLIHRLLDQNPNFFDFSVSHTTRSQREGEIDGVDYNFVTAEKFEEMIANNDFVEYAQIHGFYYGTSYAAVDAAVNDAFCILDLDVQGVEALRERGDAPWAPRFIWIAPPSISALRERLQSRGTETEETLKTRLDTATRELSYAATNAIFDLTIINDDVDAAYEELAGFIKTETEMWKKE